MGDLLLDGVTVRHDGVTAVEDVDLHVREAELLVLVGPSGCGKTTLLRTIAGLETPDAGEVVVGDTRVTDRPARHRDVSLVFQDLALFPHLTVRENLSFDLRMQGAADVEERVREAAALLDVEELLDRPIDALSGGQRQRVALGRAMVTEPDAFLLDEPLSNLDASLRRRMQREIRRLHDHLGTATVHVTHDQAEALAMGDRVAVLVDGGVQQVGTPETIYRRPTSLAVARFVGSPELNCFRGRYDATAAGVAVEDWPLVVPVDTGDRGADATAPEDDRAGPDDDRAGPEHDCADPDDDRAIRPLSDGSDVVLGVRPEDVAIDPDGADPEAADRAVADATVVGDEFAGADRFLHLDGPDGERVVARVAASVDVEMGTNVTVRVPPERVHCFSASTGERLALRDERTEAVRTAEVRTDEDRTAEPAPEGDRQ